ncbi:MAG: hypothetical protein WBG50_11755 [Desulfomonilaceae bacterium]
MANKTVINAAEVMRDIRGGMSSQDIMKKYNLSPKGLQSLFNKLVNAGVLNQSQLPRSSNAMGPAPDPAPRHAAFTEEPKAQPTVPHTPVSFDAWRCPACGISQPEVPEECPKCGIVVSKFQDKQTEYDQHLRGMPIGQQIQHFSNTERQESPSYSEDREESNVSFALILGGAGGIILLIGLFTPILVHPLGGLSFFKVKAGVAVILAACGISAVILPLINYARLQWLPGLCSLGILIYYFHAFKTFTTVMPNMKPMVDQALKHAGGNAFTEAIAKGMSLAMQLRIGWGWVVLFLGTGVILIAGVIGFLQSNEPD